ncbi:Bacteriocin-protection, YdeI or OmpD-Associated [Amycolatopsis pretoriensis]|uniref:Bacteriocin-protection, YdeI or OmpD-Associated n=1 Tax=Amycolatopsis pretoriensis TaxID=218821 RepID=A0A1H5R5W5_9PSEU|nr:YdeI/OmpD-associated family protein [Amycolatopsis pretoriensis]SEF33709.1 Bacteriocin-protection, YdeI or OmpD-Associated [Amycolatopsis pretoriensis]
MSELPEELAAALAAAPDAEAAFEALPPSHRREYVQWVAEAKKPATRLSRAEKAVQRLRDHS